ncbi:hypothetical protein OG338_17270 [Streptomyces sp. NBC_00726]|uniref:hypothetical protein n=1 Tax=Streptomyces sp. NBC_00726 TaxID=2903674 RepID=UPI00386969F6
MSARRWTTGSAGPEGSGATAVGWGEGASAEGGSSEGPPRAGRTAGPVGPPGASVRRWTTGAGTPDDGTADTVRGVSFAG